MPGPDAYNTDETIGSSLQSETPHGVTMGGRRRTRRGKSGRRKGNMRRKMNMSKNRNAKKSRRRRH